MLLVPVVANQANVNGDQQHKDQGLNESDEDFEKIEGNGYHGHGCGGKPIREAEFVPHVEHAVQEALPAKYIAVEAKGERDGAEENRYDLDDSNDEEDGSKGVKHTEVQLVLIRLVAKPVLQDYLNTRVTRIKYQIDPDQVGHGGQSEGHVEVGIGGANQGFVYMEVAVRIGGPLPYRPNARKQTAPVVHEYEEEKAAEQPEGGEEHFLSYNWLDDVSQTVDTLLHKKLSARGCTPRFADQIPDQ